MFTRSQVQTNLHIVIPEKLNKQIHNHKSYKWYDLSLSKYICYDEININFVQYMALVFPLVFIGQTTNYCTVPLKADEYFSISYVSI